MTITEFKNRFPDVVIVKSDQAIFTPSSSGFRDMFTCGKTKENISHHAVIINNDQKFLVLRAWRIPSGWRGEGYITDAESIIMHFGLEEIRNFKPVIEQLDDEIAICTTVCVDETTVCVECNFSNKACQTHYV